LPALRQSAKYHFGLGLQKRLKDDLSRRSEYFIKVFPGGRSPEAAPFRPRPIV